MSLFEYVRMDHYKIYGEYELEILLKFTTKDTFMTEAEGNQIAT